MSYISLSLLDTANRMKYGNKELSMSHVIEQFVAKEVAIKGNQIFDIFISHKYQDAQLNLERLLGLKHLLESCGFRVYVDWIVDALLDRNEVTTGTVSTLRHRMNNSKSLLFATSESSNDSKWMPWELGYMDGKGRPVAVLPLIDSEIDDPFEGQEYLRYYPYLDWVGDNETIILRINENGRHLPFNIWMNNKRTNK
jgi:hypothetical protein